MIGKTQIVFLLLFALAGFFQVPSSNASEQGVAIGSKKFTESVILGEMMGLLFQQVDLLFVHRRELGGTRVLWNALQSG